LTSPAAQDTVITSEVGGVVRLTGRVRSQQDKESVAKIASAYPGVTKVENELIVTGFSYGI
jgi:osmotically-inducible protein OsmY